MNEILGMIVYAFFMEALHEGGPQHAIFDFSKPIEPQDARSLTDNQITHYIFNTKYIWADIYWCFERIMSLGMRNMYQVTKDLTVLKQEIINKMNSEKEKSFDEQPAFLSGPNPNNKRRDA